VTKRSGRFGELPLSEPRRGLPLPLVTQQMVAHLPTNTIIDDPTKLTVAAPPAPAHVSRGGEASVPPGASATMAIPTLSPAALAGGRAPSSIPIDQTPTEISLTQHHLPDEAADPRLVLIREPDSDRAASFRVLRHHLHAAGNPQVIAV
jgi:hypothetical protein